MQIERVPYWYDDWKTTPPEPPPPDTYCILCGKPLYRDMYDSEEWTSTLDGDVCDDCLPIYEGEEET